MITAVIEHLEITSVYVSKTLSVCVSALLCNVYISLEGVDQHIKGAICQFVHVIKITESYPSYIYEAMVAVKAYNRIIFLKDRQR